ncbi:hypothetical protein BH10ACI4_BH10ACI4_10410 [soil metagenome]
MQPFSRCFLLLGSQFQRLGNLYRVFLLMVIGASATVALSAQSSSDLQINCSDPLQSSQPACRASSDPASQGMTNLNGGMQQSSTGQSSQRDQTGQQVYVDTAGTNSQRTSQQRMDTFFPPDPITDLQKLTRSSTGEMLPIFGRDLFQKAPSTFAPADQIPAMQDYVVGPGDEILLRLWGPESFNSQLTVDPSGSIYVPKVGAIHVAGFRFEELQRQVTAALNHVYRNYNLSVNLGHLHSIQVYVVGEARRPGAYTISSLSTVLNALFASGGPNVQGSMRYITIRREGQEPMPFDLYDLVLRGDKSRDIRLQQGDTIFIPAVGPQVALGGSVRHPAIYEVKGETSVAQIVQLAGGFSAIASKDQLSLERIDIGNTRRTMTVKLDAAGDAMLLRDGDVLFVNHISAGYEKTVTIRGNLANPGRFAWREGMRLSDIIPDTKSLLTNGYWRERNRLGVPTPLFEPLDPNNRDPRQYPLSQGINGNNTGSNGTSNRTNNNNRSSYDRQNQNQGQNQADGVEMDGQNITESAAVLGDTGGQVPMPTQNGLAGIFASRVDNNNATTQTNSTVNNQPDTLLPPTPQGTQQQSGLSNQGYGSRAQPISIKIPAPEIDWSYAVIERLDPNTLRTSLVPFNLGRLVQNHEAVQDLVLQPGDVVTILSQADIHVPQDEQTKYVRLEGEFPGAGVYSVGPNETLDQLVQRAGGFSTKAYLYGSSFVRESARTFQQQRLDEYISTLSTDMERAAAVRVASSSSGILDPNALAEQRSLISHLRQLRATGRIVLEFRPESAAVDSVPKIPLENGDIFRVPSRPNTVSVIGSVYGQNVFLFDSKRHVEDYVALAGKPNRIADRKHAFIIRADGSIFSRERAKGVWSNSFDSTRINPGDSIVIPEKLIKPTALRQLLDYSQILSSFGLAAAAINVIR